METTVAEGSFQDLVDGFDILWQQVDEIRSRNEEIQDFLRLLDRQVGLLLLQPLTFVMKHYSSRSGATSVAVIDKYT